MSCVVCMTDEAKWEILVLESLELPFESQSPRYCISFIPSNSFQCLLLRWTANGARRRNWNPAGPTILLARNTRCSRKQLYDTQYITTWLRDTRSSYTFEFPGQRRKIYMRQNKEKKKRTRKALAFSAIHSTINKNITVFLWVMALFTAALKMVNKIETQQRTNNDFPCGDFAECVSPTQPNIPTATEKKTLFIYGIDTCYIQDEYFFPSSLCCCCCHASCSECTATVAHNVSPEKCLICSLCRFVFWKYVLVVLRGSNENRAINNAFIQSVNNVSDATEYSLAFVHSKIK